MTSIPAWDRAVAVEQSQARQLFTRHIHYTAVCPACGEDAEWNSTSTIPRQGEAARYVIRCGCHG